MGNYREAKTESARRSPRKLVEISIRPGKAGGHIVAHSYERKNAKTGYPDHEREEHVFGAGDGEKMLDHVAAHAGVKAAPAPEPEAEEPEAGEQPAEE